MESSQSKIMLQEKGIKPSLHRIMILDYLLSHRTHPTVDTIYRDIHEEIPTLSKTTIYNTLKTLLEYELIQAITIEDNEVRYDACTDNHAHLKCIKCNELYDIDLDSDLYSITSIDGHTVMQTQIYFRGICKNCKKTASH